MTARDMQRKVEQRILSLEVDQTKFKSQDIFDWLNAGVHMFISNRVDSTLYQNGDNFANIQKELDDLRLITIESSPIVGTIVSSRKEFILPPNYRHLLSVRVQTSKGNCAPVYRRSRMYEPTIIDEINIERLYRPTAKSPTGTLIGNKLHIYFDSKFSLGNAIITHIKQPNIIGIINNSGTLAQSLCDLAESTHEDIVELAVEYASRVLNINKSQTQKQ